MTTFDQTEVSVYYLLSQNPDDVYPTKSSESVHHYEPEVIKNTCKFKKKDSFSGEDKRCFIYLTVESNVDTFYYLYADKNSENVLLFPDVG